MLSERIRLFWMKFWRQISRQLKYIRCIDVVKKHQCILYRIHYGESQIPRSDNMDKVISDATAPEASSSACMLAAKK